MNMKRIISMILAVFFLLSCFVVQIGAADTPTSTAAEGDQTENTQEKVTYTYKTSNTTPTIAYFTDSKQDWDKKGDVKEFASPEEKLATMDLRLQKDGYQIYVDAYSGEVATRCMETGEVIFTNPYNIGVKPKNGNFVDATASIKYQIMSQITIKYTDNDTEKYFYSFEQAALRGQIKVKNIKNGLRVEYTMGREEAKMLVPRLISKDRYLKMIDTPLEAAFASEGGRDNFIFKKLSAYYQLKDPAEAISDKHKDQMHASFPITRKFPVYVFDTVATDVEIARCESIIKSYLPAYTYEELEYDHELCEYESEEQNPPLFKLALEYTLDAQGMSVRLPANGLRFNEALYQMTYLSVLPYMGCGSNPNPGYTFFPDGAGAIFDFEELNDLGATTTINGKVYGQDYAYQTIGGTHQEIIRYPVFGIVETETLQKEDVNGDLVDYEKDRGFVAIIEEGDSMAELSTYHAGRLSRYNTVQMLYYPRPKDSYNMMDAISVGSNTTWTVVSSRKYTGNYKIRYILLTDEDVAKDIQKDLEPGETFEYYPCDYVGMAHAYQDYLEDTGILSPLVSKGEATDETPNEKIVGTDIPLYINTFGSIETTEKILSIPVDVMVALTSFEDVKNMYNDLAESGITNINFKLTGFSNGGMYSTMPYKLNWEKSVGGEDGFKNLIEYSKEKGFKIFPDFDFLYVNYGDVLFDGLSLSEHAVKTIDNRYTSKREYSATKQTYVGYFQLAISPAYFAHFYEKLTENYLGFFPEGYRTAISVGTLGSDLNSDFDEEEPYNREDSKLFAIEAFQYLDQNYDYVMTEGGNAYSWKYVDYLLNVPLDSSRFIRASASVPFLGIVLHSYLQFAGTPINMEGNIDYAFLKAIENGASLNFTLSVQNTTKLKEDERLSKYYSIRYDIWEKDLVALYTELNSILGDLQTERITDHKFLIGNRVPDLDELEYDFNQAIFEAIKNETNAADQAAKDYIAVVLAARQALLKAKSDVATQQNALEIFKESMELATKTETVTGKYNAFAEKMQAYLAAYKKFYEKGGLGDLDPNGSVSGVARGELNRATNDLQKAASELLNVFNSTGGINYVANQAYNAEMTAIRAYQSATEAYEFLLTVEGISDDILRFAKDLLVETATAVAKLCSEAPSIYEQAQTAFDEVIAKTAEMTEAGVTFSYNPYLFYLFIINDPNHLQNPSSTPANLAKNTIARFVPGLDADKGGILPSDALALLYQELGIQEGGTPNYDTVFEKAFNRVTTAITAYMPKLEQFNKVVAAQEAGDRTYLYPTGKKDAEDNPIYEEIAIDEAYTRAVRELNVVAKNLDASVAGADATHIAHLFETTASQKAGTTIIGKYTVDDQTAVLLNLRAYFNAYAALETAQGEKPADMSQEDYDAAIAAAKTAMTEAANAFSESLTKLGNEYIRWTIVSTVSSGDAYKTNKGYNNYAKSALALTNSRKENYDLASEILTLLTENGADAATLQMATDYANLAKARYEEVKGDTEKIVALVEEAYQAATANEVYKEYLALQESEAENDKIPSKLLLSVIPHYLDEKEDEVKETEEEEKDEFSKYLSDDNNIVLVTYENGTRFILNYCNFAVMVELDGKMYKVEAQDYVILPATAAEGGSQE